MAEPIDREHPFRSFEVTLDDGRVLALERTVIGSGEYGWVVLPHADAEHAEICHVGLRGAVRLAPELEGVILMAHVQEVEAHLGPGMAWRGTPPEELELLGLWVEVHSLLTVVGHADERRRLDVYTPRLAPFVAALEWPDEESVRLRVRGHRSAADQVSSLSVLLHEARRTARGAALFARAADTVDYGRAVHVRLAEDGPWCIVASPAGFGTGLEFTPHQERCLVAIGFRSGAGGPIGPNWLREVDDPLDLHAVAVSVQAALADVHGLRPTDDLALDLLLEPDDDGAFEDLEDEAEQEAEGADELDVDEAY